MKNIVITGSSKGIGYGLAKEFLSLGHRVMISGRMESSLKQAQESLQRLISNSAIDYTVCDVRVYSSVQKLYENAEKYGPVDIWINNAGLGQGTKPFDQLEIDKVEALVDTNLLGMMNGCQVAYIGMKNQGYGAIYNMDGFGSDGRKMKNMTVYGTSKYATDYFTRSFALETAGTGVIIGALSPGMVATELLIAPIKEDTTINRQAARIFNILADEVEPVCKFLVKEILNNRKNGKVINWLTSSKIMLRFIKNIFVKRRVKSIPVH